MASGTADPKTTSVTVRPGVYVTSTPCEHGTLVRVGIAAYAHRRGPQGAQCKACNRRWRLWFTNDRERGVEALWREMRP